jgi:prepilin-type N-terminal cleavage/methylation domain-containing protein
VFRPKTRGFTLVETMVALVVIAIILLYGFPKVRVLLVKNNLRGARGALLTAIQQAKTWSVSDGRQTTVHLAANGALWLTATPTRRNPPAGSTADTVGAIRNLTAEYGAGVSAATLVFDQRGLLTTIASPPQTIAMTKSGYRDSVMITGYGRISK